MADGRSLPIEEVARLPLPGTAVPGAIRFSPDDGAVTWLHAPDRTLRKRLFACDVESGSTREAFELAGEEIEEGRLSIDEQLRRERAREVATGVTAYAWAEKGERLLVPLADGLWTSEGVDGVPRRVVAAEGAPLLDPRLSPDGAWVAFVRDAELHVVPADGSAPPRAVTRGARASGRTHGLAEFVAQEELERSEGYWWSPDATRLAYCEVDEAAIPVYRIVHQGSDRTGEGAYEDHRYPFAGAANARVRLAVVALDGNAPTWLDLASFAGDDFYLARVDWLDRARLAVQLLDRRQRRLDVVAFDATTGAGELLLTETSEVWINLHSLLRPLEGGRFLWASERTGYRHLEVRGPDGALERQLTSGEWLVDDVVAVDDRRVWFTATRQSPLERHLYEVALDGGEPRRLTTEAGAHTVVVDHRRRTFVDVHSSASRPPVVLLRSLESGEVLRCLFDDPDPRVGALDLVPPELITLPAADGTTSLHVALYRPEGQPPFPTVVSVYGGPHAQRVVDAWTVTVSMRAQYLRHLGYLVIAADNRGSANRGVAFEGAIQGDLGNVEVHDQVAVVRSLVEAGLVDPARVGIYGWSYGGYMSAMCVARAPEVFRAAVAGAPVTHWDGYDTCYTERYMGLPDDNPDGYRRSSVMAHVDGMRGRDLLIVHGLLDENVHFRHTARLVNALVRAGIPHGLLLFPDERHLPRREEDRVFMEQRVRDFFLDKLPL